MKLIKTLCAICRKDDSKELYPANFSTKDLNPQTFSARRLPDRIHYHIVCCKKCGLAYSNPILPESTISRLYKKSQVTYQDQQDDLKRTYGRYVAIASTQSPGRSHFVTPSRWPPPTDGLEGEFASRKRKIFTNEKGRLLEIGCGNGFFLKYLKEQGWHDVWGVEPSKDAYLKTPKTLKPRIVNDVLRPNLFQANSFDFICTFQTLDHVTNPNAFLRICHKLLKPRGKILAINHDVGSWSAKLLGEKSPIIDIEHIYLFNKRTLRRIFERNGFQIESVFTTFDYHRIGYWLRMFPIPILLKGPLLKFLKLARIGNLPLVFPAGNVGIIGQKA